MTSEKPLQKTLVFLPVNSCHCLQIFTLFFVSLTHAHLWTLKCIHQRDNRFHFVHHQGLSCENNATENMWWLIFKEGVDILCISQKFQSSSWKKKRSHIILLKRFLFLAVLGACSESSQKSYFLCWDNQRQMLLFPPWKLTANVVNTLLRILT